MSVRSGASRNAPAKSAAADPYCSRRIGGPSQQVSLGALSPHRQSARRFFDRIGGTFQQKQKIGSPQ